MLTRYAVGWHTKDGHPRTSRVVLEKGYTAFGDIPKILSISNGVDVETIVIDTLERIE